LSAGIDRARDLAVQPIVVKVHAQARARIGRVAEPVLRVVSVVPTVVAREIAFAIVVKGAPGRLVQFIE